MAKYRVIKKGDLFFVQSRVGLFFPKWEVLDEEGLAGSCENDPLPDAQFLCQEKAVKFMEGVAHAKSKVVKVIATLET